MSDAVSYISEPATRGKVLLSTSIGDLDVELFADQCPKACRSFVQLCLDGYYDHCIFHRVVKGFMAQTGDPTGTGYGGQAAWGQPFENEYHSRLRFNRRGLVGMAISSSADGPSTLPNGSQFFLTLGACDFLNKQHTLFGKITGETLFNILKFNELTMEEAEDGKEGERPINPPRIIKTEVLNNPFEDIKPRKAEKRKEEKEEAKKPKKKQKKNLALLSFGSEEASEESALQLAAESTAERVGRVSKSSHDLARDARLSQKSIEEELKEKERKEAEAAAEASEMEKKAVRDTLRHQQSKQRKGDTDGDDDDAYMDDAAFDSHMRQKILAKRGMLPGAASAASSSASRTNAASSDSAVAKAAPSSSSSEYEQLKAELGFASKSKDKAAHAGVDGASNSHLSSLDAMRAKYKTRKALLTSSRTREQDTLSKLAVFQAKVHEAQEKVATTPPMEAEAKKKKEFRAVPEKSEVEIPPVPVQDDDDDDALDGGGGGDTWLAHQLKVRHRPQDYDLMRRDVEGLDYAVFDPRGEEGSKSQSINATFASGAAAGGSDRRKRARVGTVGLQGGHGGLAGVTANGSTDDTSQPVRYKSLAERDAEEENERVVKRLMEEEERRRKKRQRSRSRSRSRSRDRSRSRSRSNRESESKQ